MKEMTAAEEVRAAWVDAGPPPGREYHRRMQERLITAWPVLGRALLRLEKEGER